MLCWLKGLPYPDCVWSNPNCCGYSIACPTPYCVCCNSYYRGCSKVCPTPAVYVATVGMYLLHIVVVAAWGVLPPGGRLPLQEAIHLPLRGPLRQPVQQQSHQVNTLICFVLYTVVWCTPVQIYNASSYIQYSTTIPPTITLFLQLSSFAGGKMERWNVRPFSISRIIHC